jgi:hypothetical protein
MALASYRMEKVWESQRTITKSKGIIFIYTIDGKASSGNVLKISGKSLADLQTTRDHSI